MTAECEEAQDGSGDGAVTKCDAADKQHPKENVVSEGMMPAPVGLSAEEIRCGVNIRQDGADNTPVSESPIGASDVANHPAEGCVWFEVHYPTAESRRPALLNMISEICNLEGTNAVLSSVPIGMSKREKTKPNDC